MKAQLIIFICLSVFFSCCQKLQLEQDVPDCIEKKIEAYKTNKTPCESGKSVYRYTFQGEFVYVFNPGNCGADMMSDVYNEACNLICGLGGIAGNVTCQAENFDKNATDEKLIWKN